MLVFEERGNRSTRRKPLVVEKRTNKLIPHLTPDLGIEPGPHWWGANALTTAPSLHPKYTQRGIRMAGMITAYAQKLINPRLNKIIYTIRTCNIVRSWLFLTTLLLWN